jgi:hypothetical protein
VRQGFVGLLLLLSIGLACAETGFAELSQITASPDSLRGSFHQQKYLVALDVTLQSSGVFEYRRGESIRWQIEQPIKNELLITPTSLSSRQGDDELLRLDINSNPATAIMGRILFAVLTAQWQQLADYFTISGDIEGQQWSAELLPGDAVVGRMFERVELRGDELLRVIVLHEQGGDRTTIQLHDLQQ